MPKFDMAEELTMAARDPLLWLESWTTENGPAILGKTQAGNFYVNLFVTFDTPNAIPLSTGVAPTLAQALRLAIQGLAPFL